MKKLTTYIAMALVLLITACTEDTVPTDTQQQLKTVTLLPYSTSFFDVEEMPTRALPNGYVAYNTLDPKTIPDHTSIGVILTPENTSVVDNFVFMGKNADGTLDNKWQASIDIKDGQSYYIYGFMPREEAERASVTALNGSFENGATMTIENMNTLTSADVCVIVGVKGDNTATPPNIQDVGIQLGKFLYQGSAEHNNIYLLLKHLYSGLHFKVQIDPDYYKLRTIKIKRMTLSSAEQIPTKINLTVTLTANDTGTDPLGNDIIYAPVGSSMGTATNTMYPRTVGDTEFEVPVQTPESFLSCFTPGNCRSFKLTSVYDVYDKKGNLVRKDCEAVNLIDANRYQKLETLKAGEIYTVRMLIKPTFLYVMSDPDLDNPDFSIQ